MIFPVLKMGVASLFEKSAMLAEKKFGSRELLQLITDLAETQQHCGGIGIAAPQIGVNKQVVIIEYYQKNITRYPDIGDCPRQVIINPTLTPIGSSESAFNEGCLSVPGLRGEVIRPQKIHYMFYDEYGKLHEGEDDGMFARIIQHE